MGRNRPRIWIASALLSLASVVAPSVAAESTTLTDGVLVDVTSGMAFAMEPGGGVRAVALGDGSTVWFSKQADRPLLIDGEVLIAQADDPTRGSVLELVRLRADDGMPLGSYEVELPPGVPVGIDESRKTAFVVVPQRSKRGPVLEWRWLGASVPELTGNRGFVEFDGERFVVLDDDAARAAEAAAPSGFDELRGQRPGFPWSVHDDSWIVVEREPTDDGDRLTIHRWSTSGPQSQVALPASGATLRRLSADGRHLLASRRLGDDAYRWDLHATTDGAHVASIVRSLPAEPFLVTGGVLLLRSPRTRQLKDDRWTETPDRLVATRLDDGVELWSVAVRDTRYAGTAVPQERHGESRAAPRRVPTTERAAARAAGMTPAPAGRRAAGPGDRPSRGKTVSIVPIRRTSVDAARDAAGVPPVQQPAWVAQGPAPITGGQVANLDPDNRVVGAVQQMLAHPTDPQIAYLGAVNGGIWKTTDATAASPTWTPLTDDQVSLSIGAMALDPTDPDKIVAGLGRFSSFQREGGVAAGLLYTTDGGTTWDHLEGPFLNWQITGVSWLGNRVVVVGRNADDTIGCIYVSTSGPAGPFFSRTFAPGKPVTDLAIDPTNPDRFYAVQPGVAVVRTDDFGMSYLAISTSNADFDADIDVGGGKRRVLLELGEDGRLYVLSIVAGHPRSLWYSDDPEGAVPSWTRMDLPGAGPGSSGVVSGATQTAPIVITATAHGLSNGDTVLISGVGGLTEANGVYDIDSVTADTFALDDSDGCRDEGSGCTTTAFSSNGAWERFDGTNPAGPPGGQGAIHASLVVDPDTDAQVYVGGDRLSQYLRTLLGYEDYVGNLWRGDSVPAATGTIPSPQWQHLVLSNAVAAIPDGGTAHNTAPHADSRDMTFDALKEVLESDDGGPYRRTSTRTNLGDWKPMHGNLQITEVHTVARDALADVMMSANQDTGATEQTLAGSKTWRSISLGDGDVVAVDDLTSPFQTLRYSTSGALGSTKRRTCLINNACPVEQPIDLKVGGVTLRPSTLYNGLFLNVTQADRLLVTSGSGVFESMDRGDSLTELGNFDVPSGQTAAVFGHPMNPELIYVGVRDTVYRRTVVGAAPIPYLGVSPAINDWVRDLAVDPADPDKVWVATSTGVYRVNDAGMAWEEVGSSMDPQIEQVRWQSIEYIPNPAGDRVVVGGREGAWVTSVADPTCWTRLGDGLPNAPVTDIEYEALDDVLVVGLLGRGVFTLPGFSTIPDDCYADLQIDTVDPVPSSTPAGTPVTYTFEVRNEGPVGATGVTVTFVTGGASANLTALTPSTGSCDLPSGTCTLADLDFPGMATTASIDVQVEADDGGVLEVTGTVSSDRTDYAPGNDSATATTIVEVTPDCDVFFDGSTSNSLNNPFNWPGDTLPTTTQSACVGTGFDVIGGLALRQFNSESPVEFLGMVLSETSTINADLTITSGLNGGTGTLIARGATTITGGAVSYAAMEVVPDDPGDLLMLQGGTIDEGIRFTSHAFTECCGSGITLQDGSWLIFEAPVTLDLGGVRDAGPAASGDRGPADNRIINRSSLTHVGGNNWLDVFYNEGVVNVQSGQLTVSNGVNTGDYVVQSGAELRILADNWFEPSSSIVGGGGVWFDGGNATDIYVQGAFDVDGPVLVSNLVRPHFESNASMGSLTLYGGDVRGSGTMTVNGIVDCDSCGLRGSGTTIATGGFQLNGGIAEGRRLVNQGAGEYGSTLFGLYDGSILENTLNATFDLLDDNRIDGTGVIGTIENAGLLRKSGGGSYVQILQAYVLSTGTIEVQVGSLGMIYDGSYSGSVQLAPGTQWAFYGGTHDLATDVTGGGELLFQVGTLRPDGAIALAGDYTEYATNPKMLELDIAGTAEGTFDRLDVGGIATLAGTIQINLAEGFTPSLGDSWTILDAGAVSGEWGAETFAALPEGLSWSLDYGPTAVTLSVIETPIADVGIVKSVSNAAPVQGTQISYTLVVTNDGPDPAENVVVVDSFPAGTLTGVSGSSTQGSCSGSGPVTCTVGTLAPGGQATITVQATPAQAGMITNTASATSDTEDPTLPNTDQQTIDVVPPATADLAVSVTDVVDPISVGGLATFEVVVTNDGPDPATGATLIADWSGVARSAVQVTPTQGTCMGADPIDCDLGTIAPGGSVTITVTATADAGGILTLAASATANEIDPTLPNEDQATLTVGPPGTTDLRVAQVDSRDPVLVGSTVSYFVDVINNGPDPAPDVTLTQTLLGLPVTVQVAVPTQGSCVLGPPVSCDLGLIQASESVTVRIDVVAANDGIILHVVDVTAPIVDSVPADNHAVEPTRVDSGPARSRYMLFGVEGNGSGAIPGALHRIDPYGGANALVGDPVSPGGLSGLAMDGAGVLYGSTISGFGTTSTLVTIDPATGALTATVGSIVPVGSGTAISIGDLDWDPLRGKLVGVRAGADGASLAGEVYEIDPLTAAATLIGPAGSPPGGGGLAITPDGRYFTTRGSGGGKLREIDPNTAELIAEVSLSPFHDGLTGHPSNRLLYGTHYPSDVSTMERDGAGYADLLPGPVDLFSDLAFGRTPLDVTLGLGPVAAHWDPIGDSTIAGYDVVGGDLMALRANGGDFTTATPSCIGPAVTGTSLDVSSMSLGPGEALWFLVRARPGVGPLTYDAASDHQWGSRDAEIGSAGDCP